MTKPYYLLLITPLFLSPSVLAGSIIKCEAADGSISFADTRCRSGQKQLSIQLHKERRVKKQTTQQNLEKAAEFPDDNSQKNLPAYIFKAKFVQALSSSTSIKMSMVEYFLYRGRWPKKMEDMGYQVKDMTSSLITGTEVSKQGRFSIKLAEEFGDEKAIWFYPNLVMGGSQIEWTCYSNFPVSILMNPTGTEICKSKYF